MKLLSVLIDATALPAHRGGVGRYVDNLIVALAAGPETRVVVVCKSQDASGFTALGAEVVIAPAVVSRTLMRLVWEQLALARLARRLGVDLIHSPHYTFPIFSRLPRIVTVHDLTFFTLPGAHSRFKRIFFRWWILQLARRRMPVISVSQATADDFVILAGGSANDVTVSHLGFDNKIFHEPDAASHASLTSAIAELPERWIAFLGTLEPRKNVAALIDGYRAAAESAVQPMPALLLAGGSGWDNTIRPALDRAKADGFDVRTVGYLPLESLSAFLGASEIFVYPSLGEGFGLPVLEAMATGACVLTTPLTSLPEVGGDAVAYTGVSAGEIGAQISTLLADEVARKRLRSAAVDRANTFTWTAAAERHTRAYAEAVSRG